MPTRLNQEQKNALVDAYEVDGLTQEGIAEMYQVSRTSVQRALKEYKEAPEKFIGSRTLNQKASIDPANRITEAPRGTMEPQPWNNDPNDWYGIVAYLTQVAPVILVFLMATWVVYVLLRAYNII